MATFKKSVLVVCMACLLAVVAMLAAGCEDPPLPTTTAKPTVGTTEYSVIVRTAGGIRLDDVTVYVYEDATESDLADVPKKLNSEGKYTFTGPTSDSYTVVLQGVPAGYDVQEQYALTGSQLEITLTSAPIQGEVPAGTTYNLGDIIHDYTFTDIDGVQRKISDILKEKNALVLNFWYVDCKFCIKEFPSLQEAYALHNDKVEVLALDVEKGDTEHEIRGIINELGLTFPVVKSDLTLLEAMKATGCPATVIIDRYGMISFVCDEDLTKEPAAFRALLRHFGEEDYKQGVVEATTEAIDALISVEDIPYGCEKYPYDLGTEDFAGKVLKNELVYYNMHRSATLRIEDPDVYVKMNGQKYDPVNDVLELEIHVEDMYSGVVFALGTTGGVDKNVTLQLIPPKGTTENPYELTLGEVTFPVNNQTAYYSFTSAYTGTFTLTLDALPAGVSCGANMTNMRTNVVVDAQSADCTDPETGKVTFTIAVEAGDTVRIIFGVYSEEATNTEIRALASIPEVGGIGPSDESYSVSVRDESGAPVANVTLTVQVAGTDVTYVTGEDGVARLDLKGGTYMVKLMLPEGYYATEMYMLTPANRTLEIVLVQKRQYAVQVSVTGGKLTETVTVKIYTSSAKEELICSGELDENGVFTFAYGYIDNCVAVLEGLPNNVFVQNSYPLTGEITQIELVRTSVGDTNAANQNYQLGDKMCDFSVTTPDGRVFSLNELLEEKRVVVLTFWHTNNPSSLVTLNYLEAAYQKYGQTLEILAMNPMDKSDTVIADFQGRNGLSFPMAQCSGEWESALHLTLYPTFVVIDRDGTICLIHSGAVTNEQVLDAVLAHYTAEDYKTTIVNSMEQLLQSGGQPDGTQEDPYIVEQGTTQLSITLQGQACAYYTFQELEPMRIRVEGADAYVIYNGQRYAAVDGVVEVDINVANDETPEMVMIGNAGTAEVTMQILLTVLAAG